MSLYGSLQLVELVRHKLVVQWLTALDYRSSYGFDPLSLLKNVMSTWLIFSPSFVVSTLPFTSFDSDSVVVSSSLLGYNGSLERLLECREDTDLANSLAQS